MVCDAIDSSDALWRTLNFFPFIWIQIQNPKTGGIL